MTVALMKDEFEIGVSSIDKPTITIHRKPRMIPYHVDRTISQLGGVVSHLDGPNNRVTYEFMIPDRIYDAVEYLFSNQWKRIKRNR